MGKKERCLKIRESKVLIEVMNLYNSACGEGMGEEREGREGSGGSGEKRKKSLTM